MDWQGWAGFVRLSTSENRDSSVHLIHPSVILTRSATWKEESGRLHPNEPTPEFAQEACSLPMHGRLTEPPYVLTGVKDDVECLPECDRAAFEQREEEFESQQS
jgi:hypothetical protein